MLTDSHCHPYDLAKAFPGMEEERQRLGVLCAASASSREEFEFNEGLGVAAHGEGAAGVFPCFAIHPQLPAYVNSSPDGSDARLYNVDENLGLLESLALQGRLAAVGETGFDLFNAQYRASEAQQDGLFAFHVDVTSRYNLPLVIHARRAMHKIFGASAKLKKCRAVVFHSWPGTVDEANALLCRGINAYFSFGAAILLNHRHAIHSCAALPADRLLLKTDAPYQPLRDSSRRYSSWDDLPAILSAAASLRSEAGGQGMDAETLEHIIETNFRAVFVHN